MQVLNDILWNNYVVENAKYLSRHILPHLLTNRNHLVSIKLLRQMVEQPYAIVMLHLLT